MRNSLLALLLPALLGLACVAQPQAPTPSPSEPPASPSGSPTAASPTASPTLPATPSTSPSPTPTITLSPTPSASPTPTATLLPPTAYDPELLDTRLARALEQQRTRYRLIGLNVAVVMPDGYTWTSASGLAELAPQRQVETTTPFVVGSVTKTFIAALVMQLAAEGTLSLDDPLSKWLPDYRRHNGATLRQLLGHTSGIYNYFEHPSYNPSVFGAPERAWTPDEILATFRAPPYFAAGTGYHYSNTGFILLGLVIERATGDALEDQLKRRLLDPLALTSTHFQGAGPPPSESAQGYLVGPNGPRLINDGSAYRPTRSAATVAWAAGGIVATAADLATWARSLYGGAVVQPEFLAQMTDFLANPYSGTEYGLGTRTRFLGDHRAVGHTGSLRGFAAAMWHFRQESITIVVLSNRGRVDVNPVADALARVAMEAVGYQP